MYHNAVMSHSSVLSVFNGFFFLIYKKISIFAIVAALCGHCIQKNITH